MATNLNTLQTQIGAINGPEFEVKSESPSVESLSETIEKIREIPGTDGFYNAAAWEIDNQTYLLGRKVEVAGGQGEPDVGSLVLITLNEKGDISSSEKVWEHESGGPSLEDVRALPLLDGRISLGLTYVTCDNGNHIPHPAVMTIESIEDLKEGLSQLKVIRYLGKTAFIQTYVGQVAIDNMTQKTSPDIEVINGVVGDQATPLGEDSGGLEGKNVTSIDPNLYAFRPEGDINNHRLQVFDYNHEAKAHHKQYIDFPTDIPWGEYKMGTTMPPIWINKNEAVFIIHGIKIINNKYVYSIGTARMLRDDEGNLSVDNVSQKSIINPDSFVGNLNSDEVELHGERRVVYCCGGIPITGKDGELDHIKLYVNVGDKRTVEVTVSASKIINNWDR